MTNNIFRLPTQEEISQYSDTGAAYLDGYSDHMIRMRFKAYQESLQHAKTWENQGNLHEAALNYGHAASLMWNIVQQAQQAQHIEQHAQTLYRNAQDAREVTEQILAQEKK